MKPFIVPFTFEVGKIKLNDSITVFAKTQPAALETFNTIITANHYLKMPYKDGIALVNTKEAKLKVGTVKEQ